MNFWIEPMAQADWEAVSAIYLEGIKSGSATFESELPGWEKWDSGHVSCCRLVARMAGQVIGWAAISPVSARAAYRGVAEVSIYVSNQAQRQGVGQALLKALIEETEKNGFWTLQSGIFAINTASINLHKKCGFRIIGLREKPAKDKNGIWQDIILMERRSKTVGLD